jgi:branched-chain amino acid transport system permease protein
VTLFLTAVVAGLGVGAVYGLLALSYTVVVRSTGVFNVAQGDLMMAGVLAAYFALDVWRLPQVVALALIIVVVVAISLVEERIAVRPFVTGTASGGIGWFISTLGFSLLLQTAGTVIYGQQPVAAIPALLGDKSVLLGGLAIAPKFILATLVMFAIAILLNVFYQRSWLGTAMRAVAEDRLASALRGIDVSRVSQLAFVIAGVVTAVAAFVVAPIASADVSIGLAYGLKAFVALAVGGFGSLRGCVIGGLLLGVTEQIFDLYVNSNFEVVAGLLLILFVLVARPTGLYGERAARTV